MKRYSIGLITLLLIVGCSKEPINYEYALVEREGVYYTKDTNQPYTGPVFSLHYNGKKKIEGKIKDGEMQIHNEWDNDGRKLKEATYENGQSTTDTSWEYYENGQKKKEVTYKNGNKYRLYTFWHDNGQKNFEFIDKDGKRISSKCWSMWGKEFDCPTFK